MQNIRGENQLAYWNQRAKEYNSQYGQNTPTSKLKIQRKVAIMFDYGSIKTTDLVLEIGCGTGNYTKEISNRLKSKLTAIDLSPNMMDIAKQSNPEVKFILMDARKLRFNPETFDAVISTFLLQHVDTEIVLPEMYRVLKENGKLIFIVPNIMNPIHCARAKGFMNETSCSVDFNRWKWSQLLEEQGFTETKIYPVEFTSPYIPEKMARVSMKISHFLENIPIIRELAGSLLVVAKKN
jgi:ubiquinone/menaquinone biosynthesis C-methylase UbiE